MAAVVNSETCPRCHQLHVATRGGRPCKGHIKYHLVDGDRLAYPEDEQPPCKGTAMNGQDVCHAHGGLAPQNRAAGERRLAEAEREKILLAYIRDDHADPAETLLDLICWTSGMVNVCREQVQLLDAEDWVWGVTKNVTGGKDSGTTLEAKQNAWLAKLREAERDLAGYCVDALKVGLKQREIDLAERTAEQALPVLKAFVAAMGMEISDPTVIAAFKTSFRHLRAVPAAS